jgi:hypothetical protein
MRETTKHRFKSSRILAKRKTILARDVSLMPTNTTNTAGLQDILPVEALWSTVCREGIAALEQAAAV